MAVLASWLLLGVGSVEAGAHAAARAKRTHAAYPVISLERAGRGRFYIRTFAGLSNTKQPTYFLSGPGPLLIARTSGRGDGYIRLLKARGRFIHIDLTCAVGGGWLKVLHGSSVVFAVKPCDGTGSWGNAYPASVLRGHGRWRIVARATTTWTIAGIADSRRGQ
ncbi:hypothetical protein [Conexibacter sp. S30A1]|uniref:hypothetical protein n=1 Tax=Conexibacter sp. S30A1 TaxID=2937800 RepID=UPI00200EA75A|nr:hypothetical protein [Conexibacter sp. S30A1]